VFSYADCRRVRQTISSIVRAHSLAAAADADTISKALPGKAARKRRKKQVLGAG